jgi:ferritin-like metal-binding protein YciE
MANKLKSLEDLFHHQLRDLYSAEKQLIDALPEMSKKASNNQLKTALEDHLKETKHQKERLENVFNKLGVSPEGETCKAMQGLIKEAKDFLQHDADSDVRDAGIIADAQRVEHYEISGYGTVCTYAEKLGYDEVKDILAETLDEEKNADSKLNDIAKSTVNEKAEV